MTFWAIAGASDLFVEIACPSGDRWTQWLRYSSPPPSPGSRARRLLDSRLCEQGSLARVVGHGSLDLGVTAFELLAPDCLGRPLGRKSHVLPAAPLLLLLEVRKDPLEVVVEPDGVLLASFAHLFDDRIAPYEATPRRRRSRAPRLSHRLGDHFVAHAQARERSDELRQVSEARQPLEVAP